MKYALGLLVAFFANLLPISLFSSPSVLPSVVRVECGQAAGSGFFIAPHLLLTAAHMMTEDSCGEEGLYIDGSNNKMELLKLNSWKDMALFRTEETGTPLKLRTADLKYGEALWILGFPGPDSIYTVTHGYVSAFIEDFTKTDAVCYFGNSGGPAIDREHKVIGILVGVHPDSRMCYITSLDNTLEFVRGYVK